MSLMSITRAKVIADHLAYLWKQTKAFAGSVDDQAAPVAGTMQNALDVARTYVAGTSDPDIEGDLIPKMNRALPNTNAETWLAYLSPVIQTLDSHCQRNGASVDPSI